MYQGICEGKFSALVVQPEQLSMMAGHLPRLARLVSQDQQVPNLPEFCIIRCILVDSWYSIVFELEYLKPEVV
jgi:hypothetical protein